MAVVCLLEAEGGLRWSFACLRLKGVREAPAGYTYTLEIPRELMNYEF